MLKVVRPLRIVSKNDGLKIAVKTLLAATPSLLHLMVILFIFFMLFGIFMVTILQGALHSCHLAPIAGQFHKMVVTRTDCINYGGIWDERVKNFDSFLYSIETFFDITVGHRVRILWAVADHVR